jgi:hypothetical protein
MDYALEIDPGMSATMPYSAMAGASGSSICVSFRQILPDVLTNGIKICNDFFYGI